MVYNHAPALPGLNIKDHALVAQMDRVLASEAQGRGFDSRRARQYLNSPLSVGFFLPGKQWDGENRRQKKTHRESELRGRLMT